MNISHLNVGILHSLIGKNDGVSIVIDQTVNAMVKDMGVELGNIFFLAAHTSPRFNAQTNDVFWHKNRIHKEIVSEFNLEPSDTLDSHIHEHALYAKKVLKQFIKDNSIDLLIAHNTSHPYNFITAVGLGYLIEELRAKGTIWPKVMVWWHDSYFERPIFSNPNKVIQKYLKYLPGTYNDGIAFINHGQPEIAKRLFAHLGFEKIQRFFSDRAIVVPNTSDIPWDWKAVKWESVERKVCPPQDNYNDTFFNDVGLSAMVKDRGFSIDDTRILLQHTRIVPRKKIEVAIELAFRLDEKYKAMNEKKCVAVLVSGYSGDEQNEYKSFLYEYYNKLCEAHPAANVLLVFGEHCILSHRDIIVDKKYYKFAEIPAVVASKGGIGTYFSEIEGYGNNLLEMICYALPAVINRYEVYKTDIEHLDFRLPGIDNCKLTPELVEVAYLMLEDTEYRNELVRHNLRILEEKLDHRIIAEKLGPLIRKMFTQQL